MKEPSVSNMQTERIRESLLGEDVGRRLRCNACERRCLILAGRTGFCSARKNIGGVLHTLVYGDISSISANPIEKKPLFHFYPGTRALTIGGWSCNFSCPWCQNWEISQFPQKIGSGQYLSPGAFIDLVGRYNCQGTSISLNEPTLLLEYSLDIFDLAKAKGYYNTSVTNGYMSTEALQLLIEHGRLDAMNIDIKGDAETVRTFCAADMDLIYRNAILAKQGGIWIELTTLIIPGVNDGSEQLRQIVQRIIRELGNQTPWHISGYHPAYKFETDDYHSPTPVPTLEKARQIGIEEGMQYVYIGNVPGHPHQNTYCPDCGRCLIERDGFSITRYSITQNNTCPHCKKIIPIIGKPVAIGDLG